MSHPQITQQSVCGQSNHYHAACTPAISWQVGTATRLTILGSGEGQARILYTPHAAAGTAPAGAAGILGGDGLAAEAIDIDNSSSIGPVGKNVVVGDGDRPAPGGAVFEVGEGASLVLKKIAVLSALPSSSGGGGGGGRPALLNLLPDSFVQARACHFGMTESGGGENNGESPYALAPALAPAPAPVTMMTMMRVARGALLHLADGCSLVLDHPPVETPANVGEPVSSTDTSSDSGGWAGAAIVVERGGEMQVESTYFQGVFREDEAAKPVASWTGTRVVEKAVERWDIPHEDEHMAPEHGRDAAGGPAAGRSAAFSASPAYLGAVAVGSVARRGLLVECSEGLFGDGEIKSRYHRSLVACCLARLREPIISSPRKPPVWGCRTTCTRLLPVERKLYISIMTCINTAKSKRYFGA